VAYICDSKRCLTWFIHSAGYGFKMEVPFEIILETDFTNAAPGSGLASFVLSQPPIFYLETVSSPGPDGSVGREWHRSADWTEGHQATKVLRHDLVGSAVQLAHLVRNLQACGSDIALHSPPHVGSVESPPSPMELPRPPLAGLTGPGFRYHSDTSTPQHPLQGRKRSETGPPAMSHPASFPASSLPSTDGGSRLVHGEPSPPFSTNIHQLSGRLMQTSLNFGSSCFSDHPRSDIQQNFFRHSQPSLDDYGSIAISHGLAPRPYTTQPVPRTFYQEDARFISFRGDAQRRHSTSALSHHCTAPSPPLLTTPYHPRIENLGSAHHEALSAAASIISGLPGVPYESDDEVQLREAI
jgi:regulatory protein PHO2